MKGRIKKWFLSAAGLLIGAALVFQGPIAKADPRFWPHGWLAKHDHDDDDDFEHRRKVKFKRVYQYYYYPAQQVYYSPVKRVYYYRNGGAWVYNPILPPTIQLGNKVSISLGSPIPYVQHTYVVEQYPAVIVK